MYERATYCRPSAQLLYGTHARAADCHRQPMRALGSTVRAVRYADDVCSCTRLQAALLVRAEARRGSGGHVPLATPPPPFLPPLFSTAMCWQSGPNGLHHTACIFSEAADGTVSVRADITACHLVTSSIPTRC